MDMDQLRDAEDRGMNPYAAGAFTPFPEVPPRPIEPAAGTVIAFTKRFTEDGQPYSYVALRATNRAQSWYLSGPQQSGMPRTWEELLDFIGGIDEWRRVGIVTGYAPLVP